MTGGLTYHSDASLEAAFAGRVGMRKEADAAPCNQFRRLVVEVDFVDGGRDEDDDHAVTDAVRNKLRRQKITVNVFFIVEDRIVSVGKELSIYLLENLESYYVCIYSAILCVVRRGKMKIDTSQVSVTRIKNTCFVAPHDAATQPSMPTYARLPSIYV